MQDGKSMIIGRPIVPHIDITKSPLSTLTLSDSPKGETYCSVFFRYLFDAVTSDILIHPTFPQNIFGHQSVVVMHLYVLSQMRRFYIYYSYPNSIKKPFSNRVCSSRSLKILFRVAVYLSHRFSISCSRRRLWVCR